jgi:hypothetical protein
MQGTEKMETLTKSMHQVGVTAQKEAIAMRIITVVTLIYLPATFVSVSQLLYSSLLIRALIAFRPFSVPTL